MRMQNYIKNIFLFWFLFVLVFSNFEFLHFHSFVRVTSNTDSEFITFIHKYNYFKKIAKCLLDDFLLSLKNLLFKEKFYHKKFQSFELFVSAPDLNPIDFFNFSPYVRRPTILI